MTILADLQKMERVRKYYIKSSLHNLHLNIRNNCSLKVCAFQLLFFILPALINKSSLVLESSFLFCLSSSPGNKLKKSLQRHRWRRRKPVLKRGSSFTTSSLFYYSHILLCTSCAALGIRGIFLSIVAIFLGLIINLCDDYFISHLFTVLCTIPSVSRKSLSEFPVIFLTATDGLCSGIQS